LKSEEMDEVKVKKTPPGQGGSQTPGSTGLTYSGPSMQPLFKAADGLIVRPYTNKKIKAGDVVIFRRPGEVQIFVHRVVEANEVGIITRGDNNNTNDSLILQSEDIIGRVVSAKRRNRTLRVCGGKTGILLVIILRVKKLLANGISSVLRPAYHWLINTGLFQRWFSPLKRVKILYFHRPNGTEMQLLLGRRVIGRRMPGTNKWLITRPFRLFIDESSLPQHNTDG
jgi:signal peptidase I